MNAIMQDAEYIVFLWTSSLDLFVTSLTPFSSKKMITIKASSPITI